MRRTLGVLLVVVALPSSVNAANTKRAAGNTPSFSSGGWGKARFGMTTTQVVAAFAGEAKKLDPPESYEDDKYFARVEISDTPIGPVEHALVRFIFPSGKDRLERIYITESVVKPQAGIDIRMRHEYDELAKMLIEKYGRPSRDGQEPSGDAGIFKENTTWTLPNMVVELSYQHMTFLGEELSCFLSITYRPPLSAAERDRL